jgi:exodeoxyribonuclease VII large subunit
LRLRLDGASQRLDQLALRLQRPARALAGQGARLQALGERLRRATQTVLDRQGRNADEAARRLQRALPVALAAKTQRLDTAAARLRLLDPRQVLHRGYAWVETVEGRPVTSVQALSAGQSVRAVWADGAARARIETVQLEWPAADVP